VARSVFWKGCELTFCLIQQPWFHGTREHPNMIRDCILNGLLPVAPLEGVDAAIEDLIRKVSSWLK
jgi:hypothetical protein